MKTDYITSGAILPPCLPYPRFLLGVNVRLITKEVYAVLLGMPLNNAPTDKRGRRYLAFNNKVIADMIDRTPPTVAKALIELENAGLVERRLAGRNAWGLVHSCCNYDGGNCLLLDIGEVCVCVQSITYSLICKWFRAAVLPLIPVYASLCSIGQI